MSTIVVDCETYSELNLKTTTPEIYAAHPSTCVLMWSLMAEGWERAIVSEAPNIWHILLELKRQRLLSWSKRDPLDVVHWGPFDRIIAQAQCIAAAGESWGQADELGVWDAPNNTRWGDLSEISSFLGGPFGLAPAAEFWSQTVLKGEGRHLITRFCRPVKGARILPEQDPERWEQFIAYSRQDALATHADQR